jgi:hypothetical protein
MENMMLFFRISPFSLSLTGKGTGNFGKMAPFSDKQQK